MAGDSVLYLTNIHNPYRDCFFEQLGAEVSLTVTFESAKDADRDASWFQGNAPANYREDFPYEGRRGFLPGKLRRMLDEHEGPVIFGCYASKMQIAAIAYMRARKRPFWVNLDGPLFEHGGALRRTARRLVLSGAEGYLIAGYNSVDSLRRLIGSGKRIQPYPFSSMTDSSLAEARRSTADREEGLILCVGMYRHVKGTDILVDVAQAHPELRFRFIGAGRDSGSLRLQAEKGGLRNVEVIPFLKPELLAREYLRAQALVLPSRRECWGLVVNEAAAYGCPIVSTWGSGAAIEFLGGDYPRFLANPGDAESLSRALDDLLGLSADEMQEYAAFLQEKASQYSIEGMVEAHLDALGFAAGPGRG